MTRTHKRNKRLAAELRKTWSSNLNPNLESSTLNPALDTGEAISHDHDALPTQSSFTLVPTLPPLPSSSPIRAVPSIHH